MCVGTDEGASSGSFQQEGGGGRRKRLVWVGGPESNSLPGFNEPQSSVRAVFHHLLFGQTGGSINL